MDWSAFYWAPADFFGPGKGAGIRRRHRQGRQPLRRRHPRRPEDLRAKDIYRREGLTLNAANEIEGFLFKGVDAERRYHETGKFEYVNTGGYYHSLPGDPLRLFIDTAAEVQRAMGFQNEKDHPEVAPSQFEINYGYAEVVAAADQIQLYKLICRQVATKMGLTASFLPKPVVGVNGSGMHTNVSVTKDGKNLFWDPKAGEDQPVRLAVRRPDPDARQRHLPAAECQRQCVSPPRPALRSAEPDQGFGDRSRLDGPHPDRQRTQRPRRGPLGGAGCQPVHGAVLGLQDRPRRQVFAKIENLARERATCRTTSTMRSRTFNKSEWTTKLLGEDVKGRYADLKKASADRCARLLGTIVKAPEVQYHHEVYNQYLWNQF